MERKVIVIVGPTCSGKTELAIKIARMLNTEIISADSRQFYKYLDIGTAKPNSQELSSVKHYFIDNLLPDEDYNVSRFEKEALKIIEKIIKQNKIPIVAGGSGLYIKAIVDGIFDAVDTDENYRNELLKLKREHGNEILYERLKKVDPQTAEKLLPQNWKRVIRALEVYKLTGKSISEFQKEYKRETKYEFVQFGLNWPREILYKNIEERVDKMIKLGLIDEVKKILSLGYKSELNALNTVGYKEIIAYLNNEIDLEEAIRLIKRNTRRYAKRQLTWFRKDERITWFNINERKELNNIAEKIIASIK